MSMTPRVARKTAELRDECKWVFLSITNDLKAIFKTQKHFKKALQCCGRNPSLKKIDQYWEQYPGRYRRLTLNIPSCTDGIGYEDFSQIVHKESVITEDELLEAFQTIDVNHDGFISFKELYATLTKNGERMSEDEVNEILTSADTNQDGKLNYKEFSRLVMNTIDSAKGAAKKRAQQISEDLEIRRDGKRSRENSRTGRTTPNYQDRFATKSPSSLFSTRIDNAADDNSEEDNRSVKSRSSMHHKNRNGSRSNHNSDDSDSHESSKHTNDSFEVKLQAPNKIETKFSEPKMLRKWLSQQLKGAFFLNDSSNHIQSQSYVLNLNEDSKVFFEIEPFVLPVHKDDSFLKMDTMLIIVQDDRVRTVCAITENKIENKWCAKCELKAGRYLLFPYTTGCRFKKRQSDASNKPIRLFRTDSRNKIALNKEFNEALNTIFEMFDLDSNNRLSRKEFHLYTALSSNEDVDMDGWRLIEDTVGFEKNELTREGFIELYKIEASQETVDLDEIYARLFSLGFDQNLQIDQACPYRLTVSCERSEFKLHITEIYQLNKADVYLNDFFIERGQPLKSKTAKYYTVYEYHNSYVAAILLRNERTDDTINVELDFEQSENCLSNQPIAEMNKNKNNNKDRLFRPIVSLRGKKTKVGIFLMARNENKDWLLKFKTRLLRD